MRISWLAEKPSILESSTGDLLTAMTAGRTWNTTMSYKDVSDLFKAAAVNWVHDYAQSMGAALAFYTMFSIAPLLLIATSIAGLVFGKAVARGEIFDQLQGMLGTPGALTVQGLLESARKPAGSVMAAAAGIVFLFKIGRAHV